MSCVCVCEVNVINTCMATANFSSSIRNSLYPHNIFTSQMVNTIIIFIGELCVHVNLSTVYIVTYSVLNIHIIIGDTIIII